MKTKQTKTLESFRNTFKDGHTNDDVRHVLKEVSKLVGLHLIVVWSFRDMWGIGGDNDMAVLDDGKVYECPPEITAFLYQGDGDIAAENLKQASVNLTERVIDIDKRSYRQSVRHAEVEAGRFTEQMVAGL